MMMSKILQRMVYSISRESSLSSLSRKSSLSRIAKAFAVLLSLTACCPEPPLYLYDEVEAEIPLPTIDLDLQVYWDYDWTFGINYDWEAEWYYGWDDEDRNMWGELGYTTPTRFNLRRYYTESTPYAPHTTVKPATVEGTHFQGSFDWGYWDILCWNDIHTLDGVQSLVFDEKTTLDSITAWTNPTMHPARYNAPNYTHAFFEPEPLFAAYEQGIEINQNLEGFEYDEKRNVWVRTLNMKLVPITYIYLTQIILHNNKGRLQSIEGASNLSGMARTTTINSGRAGDDAITVNYGIRMKKDVPFVPYKEKADPSAERVDIIGGRLMTFGIPSHAANRINSVDEIKDSYRHYLDVNVMFHNGMDSTIIFDVTDQVRRRYKGGVLTMELDMDTVPIPVRPGGSGFDAAVKPIEDGGTHEFEF